jgi:hypothetical protein
MKIGDLVQVNRRCDGSSLWYKTGVVLGRKRHYEPDMPPLVRVLIENRERLFDYCSLEVINESR